jgi:branched-chain amino acid transport system ATP-binding protein
MLTTLRELKATRQLTLIVIEHAMRALMQLSNRIIVLHHGRLIAAGSPQSIGDDPQVLEAYFGAAPHAAANPADRCKASGR